MYINNYYASVSFCVAQSDFQTFTFKLCMNIKKIHNYFIVIDVKTQQFKLCLHVVTVKFHRQVLYQGFSNFFPGDPNLKPLRPKFGSRPIVWKPLFFILSQQSGTIVTLVPIMFRAWIVALHQILNRISASFCVILLSIYVYFMYVLE